MEELIALFAERYPLKKIDVGEFSKMKVSPMKVEIEAYDIPSLGRLSLLKGSAMLGLMKMESLILVPKEKDFPLFNCDSMKVGGKAILLIELYDTCQGKVLCPSLAAAKERFSSYAPYPQKSAWYDSLKRPESVAVCAKGKNDFPSLAKGYAESLLEDLAAAKAVLPAEKNPLNASYVDGLLENGGASTDLFLKRLGKEKTSILFHRFLFGTEERSS